MPVGTFKWYAKGLANILGGETAGEASRIDFLSDDMKILLTTVTHTPNADTHEFKTDITNEVVGTGYTAGGLALSSKAITVTAADSWGTARANTTPYVVGDVVRPATPNGHLYKCIVAGTSAGAPPTFPTVNGQTVADGGTLVWAEAGRSIVQIDFADPLWVVATITARNAHLYDNTPAADADKPLMGFMTFDADVISTGGNFQITVSPLGALLFFVAG